MSRTRPAETSTSVVSPVSIFGASCAEARAGERRIADALAVGSCRLIVAALRSDHASIEQRRRVLGIFVEHRLQHGNRTIVLAELNAAAGFGQDLLHIQFRVLLLWSSPGPEDGRRQGQQQDRAQRAKGPSPRKALRVLG